MALEAGTRLGNYEVLSSLGAGGMGEVYRAKDWKLRREVAIKLLHEEVAADPQRLARFEREALVLASLNHNNIATLYGFEQESDTSFLVMELVEGETLADRIARGPIPVDEAVPLFLRIAEGLEAAHEKGVIHRDLKPANIKVSEDGGVKILDFGLATAVAESARQGDLPASPDSETLAAPATQEGQILGTAAYMPPEQAQGQAVDTRADIWSFGACLYEALCGRSAFAGRSPLERLAKTLERDPDLGALPDDASPSIRRLLTRSLQKKPSARLRHIGDARLELLAAEQEEADLGEETASRPSRVEIGALILALLAGVALGWAGSMVLRRSSPVGELEVSSPSVRRSTIELSPAAPIASPSATPLAQARPMLTLSPDGRSLVYVTEHEGSSRLILRSLDSFEGGAIPGTETGFHPFFSPDGEWLAYFTPDKLMKIPVRGGEPSVLCEVATPMGGTWSDDGSIYFVHHEARLARVDESGGRAEEVAEQPIVFPSALPGGRGLLVTVWNWSSISKNAAAVLHLSPEGRLTPLVSGGYDGRYVPSGHLVFMRSGELWAALFDLETLSVRGEASRVLEEVWTDSITGASQYAFSRDGTLVYQRGDDWARTIPTWVGPEGDEEPLAMKAGVYNTFSLSPRQDRLAIQVAGAEDDIYLHDLGRDSFTRLTLAGGDSFPVWSSDGSRVFFASVREGVSAGPVTYWRQADGGGEAELLLGAERIRGTEAQNQSPSSASPDGSYLLFVTFHPQRATDLFLVPLEQEGKPRPFVATEAGEVNGMFSPDGRWVAYLSDRTGRYEVYVRPFPGGDGVWQISTGGGDDPRWSPQGSEIFYRDGPRLMSVHFSTDPEFTPESPRLVMELDFHNSLGLSFDVSSDSERFVVNRPVMAGEIWTRVQMVTNWFEELERLVPTD